VGALVKNDVLNRDLLLDIFWADGIWPRVSRHALGGEGASGDARLYEHFEALVANSGTSNRVRVTTVKSLAGVVTFTAELHVRSSVALRW